MISLTFDTDHMSEARMEEFLAEVAPRGGLTFFCTQYYGCLNEDRMEVAPHPFLGGGRNWLEELRAKRAEFRAALGWRAHSCVFSHTLAEWLCWNGYVYVSTHDSFGCKAPQPSRHMWGLWHAPIYYMDNMDFSRHRFWPERKERPFSREIIDTAMKGDGFYVFDFHPIHLLLNTPDPDWYMKARSHFLAGEKVADLRHDGYGARSFFDDLITAMRENNLASVTVMDGLTRFIGESPMPRDNSLRKYDFDESRLGLG
jgi:hypothetical protein